tara:strand:+ start:3069 stop:3398 length:330 start_codon:yes stop_codon:yes gene_type:complete
VESFFQNVYQVVNLIPKGRVTTYGAIAKYLGSPKSARMVGWALNKVAIGSKIPAHRVVNRKGILTGKKHFSALSEMANKLTSEKIEIIEDQVIDFEKYFWDPIKELTVY